MSVLQVPQPTVVKEKRVRDRRKDYKRAEDWNRRARIGLVEERRKSIRRDEDRAEFQYLSWYRDEGEDTPRKVIFDRASLLIRPEGSSKIIDFEGELSYTDHAAIQELLRKTASEDHEQVVLNMKGVTALDSAGLGILMGLHISHSRQGKEISLINLRQSVYRTIVNCGIQKILAVRQAS
jgi:stage II sporulation protein AA (anti-sigma F factor antagonist)